MTLGDLWFIVDVLFWVGFLVLEGFDFGVGMLHTFVGRTDTERRVLINTIGPIWDGNEVWLIVAGAVIFAAFPSWYATMFSTFYLALVILLLALIVRGVSFEYQRKFDDPRWRAFWRWGMTVGSALIPLLVGVALGDLLHGLPIDAQHEFTGNFFTLLTGFGIWTGITLVVLSLLLGATYLSLKTTGELHARAQRAARVIGIIAVIVSFGFFTWVHVGLSTGFVPEPLEALALMAVIAAAWLAEAKADGWAFVAAAIGIGGTVGSIFTELFPRVMISSTSTANNLTVNNTASPSYTLKVMTVVAVVSFPAVLAYQAWGYHVFRHRLSTPKVGGSEVGGSEGGGPEVGGPEVAPGPGPTASPAGSGGTSPAPEAGPEA